MDLTGAQQRQIHEALLAAFPTEAALTQMVRFDLDVDLNAVAGTGPRTEVVFRLIEWAATQGRVDDLIKAALAAAPGNLPLQGVAAALRSSAGLRSFRPPRPPAMFVPRPAEYAQLKTHLLARADPRPVALTTGLHGAGGFGKTTLAAKLCQDADVRAAFPDGIYWVALGQQPAVSVLLAGLVAALTGRPAVAAGDLDALSEALETALAARPALLVLDDAWDARHLAPFLGAGGARLVTTRHLAVVPGARWVRVDEMRTAEAVALLAAALPDPPADPAPLAALAARLGDWPLLLQLTGHELAELLAVGYDLADATGLLAPLGATLDLRSDEARRGAIAQALERSLDRLPAEARTHYQELAIFPEDTPIPVATIGQLWGLPPARAERALADLASRALVRLDPRTHTCQLHDVIRAYLEAQLPDAAAVHARLLAAWGDLLALPDAYAWDHLAYHLLGANQAAGLRVLLLDPRWLAARLAHGGVGALLGDLARLAVDPLMAQVYGALRLAGLALAADPAQLAGQLLGRLAATGPEIAALHQRLAAGPGGAWLRPVRASLTAPGGLLQDVLVGHRAEVTEVAVTPDGQRAVSASRDQTLRVWDLTNGQVLHILAGHTGGVTAVAITPDGQRAVSASRDQTLRVWDLMCGQVLHTLAGHTDRVTAVAITPDGRRAISASDDCTLRVWNLTSGQEIHTLAGHTTEVYVVVVTSDGQRAVSASWEETLRVWDLTSGQILHILAGHTGRVTAVAVTPDGQRAVSASRDQTLRVWDLRSGQILHTLAGHTSDVSAVAVTPDGRRAISASDDCTLRVWDLAGGQILHTLIGHTGWVYAVGITPDGQRAVSVSFWNPTIRVWDLTSGQGLHTLVGHTEQVSSVAFTPDGQRAVSASRDQTLRIWDLAHGQGLHTLASHTGSVTAVAVTPDGQRAVSASRDQTLRVWDLMSGQVRHTLAGHTGSVTAVAVTPNGQRAISASQDQTLRVWDLTSGQVLHILTGHTRVVTAVAVTPDGQYAFSTDDQGELRVWDLGSGQRLHTLRGHTRAVTGGAITPDGSRAVSFRDRTLRVWDLTSGRRFYSLAGHTEEVTAVAVTPDGQRAVSASQDQTLRVWDLTSGQVLHTLAGHTKGVTAVAVTPDGQHAVSASRDQTLRVWDLPRGQGLHTLAGHTGEVTAMAVTPDGQRTVSVSRDQTLRVWDLAHGVALAGFTADAPIRCCAVTPAGRTILAGDQAGGVHILYLEGG